MTLRTASLALVCAALAAGDEKLDRLLARVSEEAEVFSKTAPKLIAQETLRQRAREGPPRFRPRVGAAAVTVPTVRYQNREITSEYGWSTFKDSPGALHELRQVVSVDGRQVKTHEKARTTLTMGITSEDDRIKKRMLEDFEKHGLAGAVTDFGQVILLFTRRRMADYSYRFTGAGRVGAVRAMQYAFEQKEGEGALTIFQGRRAIRRRLQGTLWVRDPDGLPLRISLESSREEGRNNIRDEAVVDYNLSSHGVLIPVSVVHRQYHDGVLMVENQFLYAQFRMFAAASEVKFETDPGRQRPSKTRH